MKFRVALVFVITFLIYVAANARERQDFTLSPPAWVIDGVSQDCDFANQRYFNCPLDQAQSVTRASVGYAQDDNNIWRLFPNNVARIGSGKGQLIEASARTNDALWSRDMTQVGTWTAVGTGTSLNAIGIDGIANSATTLTATGTASSCTASCTILQTITLGSSADTYSVWLKRITGSGTVNITINNLTGVQACVLNTTSFTQCSVTATLANPVVGIQMTVLNDSVIADFNQLEPGGFASSPILTTSGTATRAADNSGPISKMLNTIQGPQGFMFVSVNGISSANALAFPGIVSAAGSNTAVIYSASNGGVPEPGIIGSASVHVAVGGAATYFSGLRIAVSWDGTTVAVGGNGVTSANSSTFVQGPTWKWGATDANLANTALFGYIARIAVGSVSKPVGQLGSITK
jgi:hypothetical protein